MAAWSDVLDDINVFPVADGDTGRNLTISLTPLRYLGEDRENTVHKLLMSARGNSGNIATRFFSGFLKANAVEHLPRAAKNGRDLAWEAVHNPVPGTMLTVFDALTDFLGRRTFECDDEYISDMIDHLEQAVRSTPELLPRLKDAGVVDSGALGMYIFLEGFIKSLANRTEGFRPIAAIFDDMLKISPSFQEETRAGYCVDTTIRFDADSEERIGRLSDFGESVVVFPHHGYYKVHLHTADKEKAKNQIESLGDVVKWSDDNIEAQTEAFKRQPLRGAIHIMTDAAGSVTRKDSRRLGITLLDSYIIAGEDSMPETLFSPTKLYESLRAGLKVSTSQASVFERHQHYQKVVHQYPKVLYLCVGSVFTGNYDVVMTWKQENDPDNRLTVIDTGAASGRLGAVVIATARYATKTHNPDAVIDFARRAVRQCEEYVFLDRLKYLAAGGRLSKSRAFFGDMFQVKPIISPTAEGAKKIGTAKDQSEQLKFAIDKLAKSLDKDSAPFIMLEYSDNRAWVHDTAKKAIESLFPSCDILLQPLSLTSGTHMGPGTWAVAFLPELI
jgi:DegV family protein with EDD domain